jgi:hypothetical protein
MTVASSTLLKDFPLDCANAISKNRTGALDQTQELIPYLKTGMKLHKGFFV